MVHQNFWGSFVLTLGLAFKNGWYLLPYVVSQNVLKKREIKNCCIALQMFMYCVKYFYDRLLISRKELYTLIVLIQKYIIFHIRMFNGCFTKISGLAVKPLLFLAASHSPIRNNEMFKQRKPDVARGKKKIVTAYSAVHS